MKTLTEYIREAQQIAEAKKIDGYVVVDMSDESVHGNYDADSLEDAIADADEMLEKNRRGSYWVVACYGNEYDLENEETIVHKAE